MTARGINQIFWQNHDVLSSVAESTCHIDSVTKYLYFIGLVEGINVLYKGILFSMKIMVGNQQKRLGWYDWNISEVNNGIRNKTYSSVSLIKWDQVTAFDQEDDITFRFKTETPRKYYMPCNRTFAIGLFNIINRTLTLTFHWK